MAIVNRIVSSLHNNNIVPGYMNAYRKGFGTLDGIITLKCFIENSRRFNRKLLLLSWDFSQAFDKCSQLLTQECLKILGFSNFVISALANLPTSAIAKLCVNFAETRFPMLICSSGWPQGLSSSAQGFSLAMLCLLIKLEHANVSGYKIKLFSNEEKSKRDSFISKENEKIKNENTKMSNKEAKKKAQSKWNCLPRQQKKKMNEELVICSKSEKCIHQLAPVISYSDDGFLLIEYENVEQIFKVMDIFKKIGCFSNLDINCDKADVYHINFSFNDEEKSQLLNYGFKDEKILDENHCLTSLGHNLKPSNLKESAKIQLNETTDDIKGTINAYNGSITLQGRKLIANSLILSKIYSFSPACYFSKSDFLELQKIIDSFVHKKKISSGGRKYLPLKYAGLYIPEVYHKHLTLRVSLIKKMFYKISNELQIPSWCEILIHVLKLFGFKYPKILLRTLGVEDVKIVIRILRNQGLKTLASIFEDIQRVNLLFQKNANIDSKHRKNKNKKSNSDNNKQRPRQHVSQPEYQWRNMYFFEDRPLGSVRNSQSNMEECPDPHNYRSVGVIGSRFCGEIKRRNQLSMMTLWDKSCNKDVRDFHGEFPARNSYLEKYADLGIFHIFSLLDRSNSPRESQSILVIRNCDDTSKSFHEKLTTFTKHICDTLFESIGPASPSCANNDFLSWMNVNASHINTRNLYCNILKCIYLSSELTAIKKLSKVPLIGPVNEKRVCSAMNRISKGINSAGSLRASVEFALGSFRSNIGISAFTKTKQCQG